MPTRSGRLRRSDETGDRARIGALRRGFTLVELIVAAILLGTLMLITVPTLKWASDQRRDAQKRQEAVEEAANLMERLTARPWDELTNENLQDVTLAEELRPQFPGAELEVAVQEADDAKRIRILLHYADHAGRPTAPVRLTAWVQRQEVRR
ncbi:MAG: type II secretion system protein [Planctomycetaceae bacterium]